MMIPEGRGYAETAGEDGRKRRFLPMAKIQSPLHSTDDSVEVEAIGIGDGDGVLRRSPSNKEANRNTCRSRKRIGPRVSTANTTHVDKDILETQATATNRKKHNHIEHYVDNVKGSIRVGHEVPGVPIEFFSTEEEKKDFDLMNISITIYGITGIVCEEKDPKKSKRRLALTPVLLKEKDSSSSATKIWHDRQIPTTVAASVKRNAISSQTVIETFLPSQPINIKSTPGKSSIVSALWQRPSAALLEREDPHDENHRNQVNSSFQVLRMMMKKPFAKDATPGLVENYVHEHIQIGVNLCRGKELMRLGVATLIVTGEEEGQIMMHVPARPCAQPGIQETKPSSRSRKKTETRRTRITFDDHNLAFRLEENASLLVGVQVHPQQDVEAAERHQEVKTPAGAKLLQAAAHEENASSADFSGQFPKLTKMNNLASRKKLGAGGSTQEDVIQNPCPLATSVAAMGSTKQLGGAIFSKSSILSGLFCGAITKNMKFPGDELAPGRCAETSVTKVSSSLETENRGMIHKSSFPVSEVMNVKYAPAYAKSFFSSVTFSNTEVSSSDDDLDVADVVQISAKQLALM